jgi:quercetin dioxygenase-like cupin family protein
VTIIHEGSVRMTLGEEVQELGAGSWSVVPGDLEHGITAGPKGASFTAIIVPRRASADAYEEVGDSALGG